jgi:predicted DNA binding CopG/RHH family protein
MQTKEKIIAPKTISAEEFDRRFDAGEDMHEYMDWTRATRPGLELKRINIDLPQHVIEGLDRKARERGITRQSLIKVMLFDAVVENEREVPGLLEKAKESQSRAERIATELERHQDRGPLESAVRQGLEAADRVNPNHRRRRGARTS